MATGILVACSQALAGDDAAAVGAYWAFQRELSGTTTADSTFAIVQNDVLTIGKTYKVSLRFKPNNNGTFRVRLGGSSVTFSTSSFTLNE